MIDEEEKQKYCEATKCSECTQWHKHCNAECCKTIVIGTNIENIDKPGKYLSIHVRKLSLSDVIYYRNHDVDYLRGMLRFRKDRIEVIGRKVFYFYPCNRLDGNLCLDHPDKKPELCKALTLDTSKVINKAWELTPNCLFKYKLGEVKEDD